MYKKDIKKLFVMLNSLHATEMNFAWCWFEVGRILGQNPLLGGTTHFEKRKPSKFY